MSNQFSLFTSTRVFLRGFLTVVLGCLSTGSLLAQVVEEVIVEAEVPEDQPLNDLVSVSALSGEKLADAGIENVEDVAAYVPNLVLAQTETGTNIVIRGIGAGVNQGFDQSVGLYIDGVPLPRSQMARAPFLDLSNVQVLRGPQYVLDGNYSLAGSVHMLTNLATDEFEAGIDVNIIPSQNDSKILLTAGIPISESFGARFALQSQKSDGYVENVTRNEDGPSRDELLARMVLSWNPTESTSVKFKVESGQFDTYGRQIEIIQSEPVPDIFDQELYPETFVNYVPGVTPPREAVTQAGIPVDPSEYNDFDRLTLPLQISWDRSYDPDYFGLGLNGVPFDNSNSTSGQSLEYYRSLYQFVGTSYLDLLASYYTDTNPLRSPGGPYPVPAGLLDTTFDYKRGADLEEYSLNDSLNLTINLEQWIGKHQLKLVASYIDYSLDEQIDSDFTAAPVLTTTQQEEYTQNFFRIDYISEKDRFFELEAGVSYLQSELSYRSVSSPNLIDPADADFGNLDPNNFDDIAQVNQNLAFQFNPLYPLDVLLGRGAGFSFFSGTARLFSPFRFFDQSSDTVAGFMQGKINWSDTVRSTVGVRYTRAEKEAKREISLLFRDGTPVTQERVDSAGILDLIGINTFQLQSLNDAITNAERGYAEFFGVLAQSDAYSFVPNFTTSASLPLSGTRVEENLLPSFSLEWDVTEDLTLIGSARKAAKLGGFDARSNSIPNVIRQSGLPPGSFEFEEEKAITYELGAKWFLPNGMGELYTTLFHTQFDDLQISVFDGRSGVNVINANGAETTGVEMEGLLNITDAFNINFSMAWIDFEFTEFERGPCYFGRRPEIYYSPFAVPSVGFPANQAVEIDYLEEGAENYTSTFETGPDGIANEYWNGLTRRLPAFCDLTGSTNQYVAEWQGTVSLNYEKEIISLGLFKPTLDILYNDGYFATSTLDPDIYQEAYFQFNGRLALASYEDTWEIALTGQNLTNEKVISYANELPISSRTLGSKAHYGFVNPPRAMGLNFRYKFY